MERLLVLKLEANGCEAEALLNGIPITRCDDARPRSVIPVHEYTLQGENRLELVIFPRPAAEPAAAAPAKLRLIATGHESAHLRILLPRAGSPVDEGSARSLGQIDWQPAADIPFLAPLSLTQDLTLPVSFPRWRWLDAPMHQEAPSAELHAQCAAFLATLAEDLSRGQTDVFMNACRLRTEELAAAYQRNVETERNRLREALLEGYASQGLQWPAPKAEELFLRPLANGRMLEALGPDGAPALQSAPDEEGKSWALPLRLAWVENRFYVLR
ncbi:hypothetical protein [Pelomonas sp. KK5]|uniref:hypothetical protein n=1 Tax=Pelomonas sp. KK5 TaxID=1855730 RepID=UPI00097C6049|nr:hypothetical protein [Pelomonas sp. KK5]